MHKNIRKRNERGVSANPALVKAFTEIKIGTGDNMCSCTKHQSKSMESFTDFSILMLFLHTVLKTPEVHKAYFSPIFYYHETQ